MCAMRKTRKDSNQWLTKVKKQEKKNQCPVSWLRYPIDFRRSLLQIVCLYCFSESK